MFPTITHSISDVKQDKCEEDWKKYSIHRLWNNLNKLTWKHNVAKFYMCYWHHDINDSKSSRHKFNFNRLIIYNLIYCNEGYFQWFMYWTSIYSDGIWLNLVFCSYFFSWGVIWVTIDFFMKDFQDVQFWIRVLFNKTYSIY